jgi:hypothetical protein
MAKFQTSISVDEQVAKNAIAAGLQEKRKVIPHAKQVVFSHVCEVALSEYSDRRTPRRASHKKAT